MFRWLQLGLVVCLLSACATGGGGRGARPLGPLRAFSQQEWRRIEEVQPIVRETAWRHRMSPALVNGMIWVESKFNRHARNRRGPKGLLQLMPRTGKAMAKRLGRRYAPYRPEFNIPAGVAYLDMMVQRFGSVELALAAYNGGPGAVVRWRRGGSAPPGPRQPYVRRVLRAARAFCERLPIGERPWDSQLFRCPSMADPADPGLSDSIAYRSVRQ